MNGTQAHEAIREALAQIAPEVDIDTVAPDERFRSAADLDSLDFLSLVERLHVLTGVDIPETDYPLVETMHGLTTYLTARAA
jgi:acyl carrier protein